jgi:hypothetical protein
VQTLNDHGDTLGLECVLQELGNLLRHALLHL